MWKGRKMGRGEGKDRKCGKSGRGLIRRLLVVIWTSVPETL